MANASGIAPEDPNYDSGDEISSYIVQMQQAMQVQQHKQIWEQEDIDVQTVASHCVSKFREWQNGGIINRVRSAQMLETTHSCRRLGAPS